MKVIELDKKYCREFYNGDFFAMIKNCYGLIFDEALIQKAFNFGNGSISDFKKHIANNRCFCKYYDLENNKYI